MPRIGLLGRSLHLADPAAAADPFDPVDEGVLPFTRRWFYSQKTVISAAGITTDTFGTAFATLADPGALTTAFTDATGTYNNYATGGGAGDFHGIRIATASAEFTQFQQLPSFFWAMKTGAAVTSQRIWIGWSEGSGATAFPDASAPFDNTIAFRYDTVAGDTNWQAVTRGTSSTTTDTGVAVTADTRYELAARARASSVEFRINGTLVATNTTNMPAATAQLFGEVVIFTQVAASRSLRWQVASGISN